MTSRNKYEALASTPGLNRSSSEKNEESVFVGEIGQEQLDSLDKAIADYRWDPGFRKRFPWVGFCALLTVLACAVSSVLVLYCSDKVPAALWFHGNAPPNVLLSVLNNLSNIALTVAVGQGVAISWWRGALAGNTIKQLHYSWSFSTSLSNLVTKFRYFNAIALAALMTKVAVIDGVLYQKATSAYLDAYRDEHHINVTAFCASSFPPTGVMGNTEEDGGFVTEEFASVATLWDTIVNNRYGGFTIDGCIGVSCKFNLTGPGFAADCTNHSTPIDYGLTLQKAERAKYTNETDHRNLTLFSIDFRRVWPSPAKNYSAITLELVYPDSTPSENDTAVGNGSCPANLIKTVCELRPALLNYTIFYTNASSTPKSQQRSARTKPDDSSSWLKDDWTNPFNALLDTSGIQLSSSCEVYDNDLNVIDETCLKYDASLRSLKGIEILRNDDVVEPHSPGQSSSLEGFVDSFQDTLSSHAYLEYGHKGFSLQTENYITLTSMGVRPDPGYCNYSWMNPLDTILYRVNSLAMMTVQSKDLHYYFDSDYEENYLYNHTYNSSSLVTYQEVYYSSDHRYTWAALVASSVIILCVLPVYWGFWELGRKVTLSPFEIANAFQGPAFAHVRGHDFEEVLRYAGRQSVVYGHIDSEDGTKYAFKLLRNDQR